MFCIAKLMFPDTALSVAVALASRSRNPGESVIKS